MVSTTDPIALQHVTESTVVAIDPRLQSNAAAIVFDDFVVAVDVGMRPFASRLFREALEDTYGRPVRYACVTHEHGDHTLGLGSFKDVALIAPPELAAFLEHSPDFAPETLALRARDDPYGAEWLDEVELVIPSLQFHERMDIACKDRRAEFHHSGGHTKCSVYGYLPDEKVLFAGDLMFAGMFPFAGDPTCDPEAWITTLWSWTGMAIDHVIPGHGPVSGPREIVNQLEFLETLRRNTLEALAAGKGPEGIALPPMYPAGDKPWFAEKTVQHWHGYYGAWS